MRRSNFDASPSSIFDKYFVGLIPRGTFPRGIVCIPLRLLRLSERPVAGHLDETSVVGDADHVREAVELPPVERFAEDILRRSPYDALDLTRFELACVRVDARKNKPPVAVDGPVLPAMA